MNESARSDFAQRVSHEASRERFIELYDSDESGNVAFDFS